MTKKKRSIKKNRRSKRKFIDNREAVGKRKKTAWLNILPHDQWYEVPRGITLYKALQEAEIEIAGDCGGMGKCGKCRVRILTSIPPPREKETLEHLSQEEINQGMRLACRMQINKDLTVYIGKSRPDIDFFQILKIGQVPGIDLDPLLVQEEVELEEDWQSDGRSNVDMINALLASSYPHLRLTLSALRALAGRFHGRGIGGTVVIHPSERANTMLAWRQGRNHTNYGLVFDLGTSTLVAKLINLNDGQQEAAVSCLNSQKKFGADVISRLQHAAHSPEALQELHRMLLDDLNDLISRILPIVCLEPSDVFVVVAAGNTTMQHFLLNVDPAGIAQAPFAPVINDAFITRAVEVGLDLHPEAKLYLMPSKSGYIGGDMVSFILASEAADQDEKIILGLDLGTNGEMFLGNRRRMLTCSTAAGPALEGSRISSGSIARSGAIEGVRFQDGKLHYKNIGNIDPISICGSGLVDLVAVLLHCGVIDDQGLIGVPQGEGVETLKEKVIYNDGVHDFLVADGAETYHGESIYLLQKDVRELQYAKSAIAAGIEILCKGLGITPLEIDAIYLAGALGNYVNMYSAMRIGLIPMIDPDAVVSLGNAASTGAAMSLLSRKHWNRAQQLARKIEHVELSLSRDFTNCFIANMDFPGVNIWDKRQV